MWAALPLRWVNPPTLDEEAHHKPYQLAVAMEVGLPIPRTLITNDAAAARRFSEELGLERTVYKTFLATERHWRETRILHQDELDLLDRVALAPVIFQEYVPAVADIRVTVFGDELFATAITPAPGGYDVDYRMDLPGAGFTPTDLPDETIGGIRSLMRRLGLVYGAIDLRRTAEGEHVFLEVNPAGEWRFVEDRTGQPMTEAMAGLLAGLDRGGRTPATGSTRGTSPARSAFPPTCRPRRRRSSSRSRMSRGRMRHRSWWRSSGCSMSTSPGPAPSRSRSPSRPISSTSV
jgi:hypothetical protein